MNRRAKLGLILAALVFVALASTGGVVGVRAWRARQPFVLEDDDTSFTPGQVVVGGDVIAARQSDPQPWGPGSRDGPVAPRVRIYSLDARRALWDLVDPEGALVSHLQLSPTGDLLATVVARGDGSAKLRLWKVASRAVLWTADAGDETSRQVRLVEFARDGSSLALLASTGIERFTTAEGKRARTVPYGATDAFKRPIFLAGGYFALTTVEPPLHLLLRTVADASHVGTIPYESGDWFRFSSTGARYAVARSKGGVAVHEIPSDATVAELSGPTANTTDEMAFSPDDRLLAVATVDGERSVIRCLDLATKREVSLVAHAPEGKCGRLEFASDRPVLVAQYSGKIQVFPFTRR